MSEKNEQEHKRIRPIDAVVEELDQLRIELNTVSGQVALLALTCVLLCVVCGGLAWRTRR